MFFIGHEYECLFVKIGAISGMRIVVPFFCDNNPWGEVLLKEEGV